jgi:hypothetical protein
MFIVFLKIDYSRFIISAMESHKIYDVADMLFYISSLLPFDD